MLREHEINLLRVLQEGAQSEKGGEVVVKYGTESGLVFFARNKVAWVVASSHKKTFTNYLTEHTQLNKSKIKQVFEDCKQTGNNFGETIVEWGLLDESTLRQLLLQHIAETMLEILSWPQHESTFIPKERSYKGSLTYGMDEVLQATVDSDKQDQLSFGALAAGQLLGFLTNKQNNVPISEHVVVQNAVLEVTAKQKKTKAIAFAALILAVLIGGLLLCLTADKKTPSDEALAGPKLQDRIRKTPQAEKLNKDNQTPP